MTDKSKNNKKRVTQNSKVETGFREQYDIIREDILKLRVDLQKGYDMAKELLDKKGLLKSKAK
jgi:hypothetical protein